MSVLIEQRQKTKFIWHDDPFYKLFIVEASTIGVFLMRNHIITLTN